MRRGDFQYKKTRVSAADIYKMTQKILPEKTTLYIATDERDKSFFDDLRKHYHVVFLDDFHKELGDMNSNFFGTSADVGVVVLVAGRCHRPTPSKGNGDLCV